MSGKTTKKAAAKKAESKSDDQDLATSGRDSDMVAKDADQETDEVREAQQLAATGGGGQGVAPALLGEPSSALNPAFYPDPEA